MYEIKVNHQINNSPWEKSLMSRCRYLNEMIRKGYHINIIIYETPDSSTFRYRCYNIYQTMQQSEQWKVMYFYSKELSTVAKFFKYIDIVTIARVRWTNELQIFIDEAKQYGIPILFDVDDLVYDVEYFPLVTNTISVDFRNNPEFFYDFWFAQIGRIDLTARQADGYVGTNSFLCNTFHDRFGKAEYVIPNFLNTEQVQISELCVKEKKKQTGKKPFSLGYFSGSPTHINDFKTIYMEIIQLLQEYDDIVLDVVGYMEFPDEMKKLVDAGRVRFTNPVDFVTLQELVASVDVNLVPLVVNKFTNCKSELKFFEAAIVNTITCAADTYTYAHAITNGVNGFICKPTEWYSTIKKIYLGEYNTSAIIKNAHDYALETYYGRTIVNTIEDVYNTVIKELANG